MKRNPSSSLRESKSRTYKNFSSAAPVTRNASTLYAHKQPLNEFNEKNKKRKSKHNS